MAFSSGVDCVQYIASVPPEVPANNGKSVFSQGEKQAIVLSEKECLNVEVSELLEALQIIPINIVRAGEDKNSPCGCITLYN
jgi:hypothetical protein